MLSKHSVLNTSDRKRTKKMWLNEMHLMISTFHRPIKLLTFWPPIAFVAVLILNFVVHSESSCLLSELRDECTWLADLEVEYSLSMCRKWCSISEETSILYRPSTLPFMGSTHLLLWVISARTWIIHPVCSLPASNFPTKLADECPTNWRVPNSMMIAI